MGEWSGTRLYLGNLPKDVREKELEDFFNELGHGEITEIKLMDGFGFIQYSSADDAKDVVPAFHGRDFQGHNLIVQFARGHRHRDGPREGFSGAGSGPGFPPRPRRTPHKMSISGLPPDTSWQDLKDFARRGSDNVVYSDISRDRNGHGTVEFETGDDLKRAVSFLDGQEYRGVRVNCVADDTSASAPPTNGHSRYSNSYSGGPRGRSRSPHRGAGGYRGRYSPPAPRGGYSPPPARGYGRERAYGESPPHGSGYRERSPRGGRRDPYYSGGGRDRSPPRRAPPPVDEYPPPSRSYSGREEPYPQRRAGYEDEPYHGGHSAPRRGGGYDELPPRRPYSPGPRGRTPPPRSGPPPTRGGGYDDYDRSRRDAETGAIKPPTGPRNHQRTK